jgi:S-adenosylmethionine:tRNA ribosyltransferase-isomerase
MKLMKTTINNLNFALPAQLEASEPPEARGLARDDVRLMVSSIATDHVVHTHFRAIADFLAAGDLLVINTSGTINAAIPAIRTDGTLLELHLSTHLSAHRWSVEVRAFLGKTTRPAYDMHAGETLRLPEGASVTLLAPHLRRQDTESGDSQQQPQRLWIAALTLSLPLYEYLAQYGHPIRYSYVEKEWPLDYYQTVYATEPGSAEMPSAGRAFTPELITRLVAHGVQIAPLILHTGVASLESHEPPFEEYYRVPPETARLVNAAHASGKRVIAVGTTVVRALETVADINGSVHPGEGWTDLVITPQRGIHAINGLLTGLHEPQASHLFMLQALAGLAHLRVTYHEALNEGYLWHEFGDLHLILP